MKKHIIHFIEANGKRRRLVRWISPSRSAEYALQEEGFRGVRVVRVQKWRSSGLGREGYGNPKNYV